MGLFQTIQPEEESQAGRPLADRMRPQTLDEFIGQEDLLGPGKPLRVQIERDELTSLLLWGPPGCGKTTLARIIARMTKSEFIPFSAVLSGIKEIKEVMAKAEAVRRYGRRTIVFVDEVHRFNRAQQDAFLAACGSWKHFADRRDDRKSFLRGDRAAAFAHESVCAESALGGANRDALGARARRSRFAASDERTSRHPRRFWSASQSLPTATRALRITLWRRS